MRLERRAPLRARPDRRAPRASRGRARRSARPAAPPRRRCRRRPGRGGRASAASAAAAAAARRRRPRRPLRRASGSGRRTRCPCPCPSLSALTVPPCSCDEAAHDRQARARARPARGPSACRSCTNRSKIVRQHLGCDADAVVADPQHARPSASRAAITCDAAARLACTWRRWSAGSRPPARAASGRRRRSARARHVDDRAVLRAARAAGSPSRWPRATTSAISTGSCRSSTLPRVMRETSSRSSTSRTRCATWRSMIGPLALDGVDAAQLHQLQRREDRRERIAQLVTEHGEELVLGAVRVLGRAPQAARSCVGVPAPDR